MANHSRRSPACVACVVRGLELDDRGLCRDCAAAIDAGLEEQEQRDQDEQWERERESARRQLDAHEPVPVDTDRLSEPWWAHA